MFGVLSSPKGVLVDIGQARCAFIIGKTLTEIRKSYKREEAACVLAATTKTTMADTERGLENRAFPNPRFYFE